MRKPITRKTVLAWLAASGASTVASTASAQIPGLPRVPSLPNVGQTVRQRAEDAALDRIAQSLFPLERTNTIVRPRAEPPTTLATGPFKSMRELERTPTGGFVLRRGAWEANLQSYCLKAGTHERTGGGGYLSGQWTGKVAQGVQLILSRLYARPQVRQTDAQYLIWALLSRLRPSDLQGNRGQDAARALLTPAEYAQFDGGAFSFVPPQVSGEVRRRLPPEVQRLLQVEENMRQRARRGASYEELAALAVLRGEPPPSSDPPAPEGQWNAHPDGFLIRYFSQSYARTTVQLIALEDGAAPQCQAGQIQIVRGGADRRIVRAGFAGGTRVRLTYAPGTLRDASAPELRGFLVTQLDYERAPGGEAARITRPFVVWQWRPGARWRERAALTPVVMACQGGVFDGIEDDVGGRLRDQAVEMAPESVQRANQAYEWYEQGQEMRPGTQEDIDNIGDMSNIREGMEEVVAGDTASRLGWIGEFHAGLARALDYARRQIETLPGGTEPEAPVVEVPDIGSVPVIEVPPLPPASTGGPGVYEPPYEVGLPSNSGVQTRGLSGRWSD